MSKRLVIFGTAALTTLLALLVLWQFRIVIVYVLISLALAAAVRPLVKDWASRKFGMRLMLILLYLISLGGFGFLFFLVGKFAIVNIEQLAQTLLALDTWTLPSWLAGSLFQQMLVAWLPMSGDLLAAFTGEQGQFVLLAILGFTQGIGGVISDAIVILFLSIYWSVNQIHFERLWLSLLPPEQRKQARDIWRTIEPNLGAYIRSEIVQSLLAVLLLSVGYWLLGCSYPMLLALIGALARLIPVVGAPLALILPLLIGLQTSLPLSLFMVLYTLAVLIALQVWVEPLLFKRKWDNPILTLVIMLAMADAFGLLGILIAPPLSAICQILWNQLVSNPLEAGAATRVSDLKERQSRLLDVIQEMSEPPPPLVVSSMGRLTNLLEKAELILQVNLPVESKT
ncbi:MAG: AI-2E family transporter [Anaerolineales bacterium]